MTLAQKLLFALQMTEKNKQPNVVIDVGLFRTLVEEADSLSLQVSDRSELLRCIDDLRSQNVRFVYALRGARYDLYRIATADWTAGQMQAAAIAAEGRTGRFLKDVDIEELFNFKKRGG